MAKHLSQSVPHYSEADEMRDNLGGLMGRMMMKKMSDQDMKQMRDEMIKAMIKKVKNNKK